MPDKSELSGGDINPETRVDETFKRMDDVELVLRFFAYRQRLSNQDGALKGFHDAYLRHANKFAPAVLRELEDIFKQTIRLANDLFGETAFYLWRKRTTGWGWFRRPTTVVYDPMMFVLSQFLDHRAKLIEKESQIKIALKDLYEREYDQFQGRYTNRENLVARNKLFLDLFREMVQ